MYPSLEALKEILYSETVEQKTEAICWCAGELVNLNVRLKRNHIWHRRLQETKVHRWQSYYHKLDRFILAATGGAFGFIPTPVQAMPMNRVTKSTSTTTTSASKWKSLEPGNGNIIWHDPGGKDSSVRHHTALSTLQPCVYSSNIQSF